MSASEVFEGSAWTPGSLLASLCARDQEILLKLGRARRYEAGEILFREGEYSDFVVIIVKGCVKIYAVTDDGARSLLAVRTAGDIVGELAAMDGGPRSATAQAGEAVFAQIIMKAEFDRCLAAHYAIARALNQAVSGKLRMATRRRVDFRRDIRQRLARVLMDLCHGSGEAGEGDVRMLVITQAELAGLIGASEPTVHKALRALRDARVVSTRYGRMAIENIALLRQIAEGEYPDMESL